MDMKVKIFSILAAAAFLAGCGGGSDDRVAERELPAVQVAVEAVPTLTFAVEYEAVGTVQSVASSTLSAKVLGHIKSIKVVEGDRVRAGQTLVVIDSRDADVQLSQAEAGQAEAQAALREVEQAIRAGESAKRAAEANAELASSTYKRFEELLNRKSISQQEFDEAKARFTAAEAEVNRANEMLEGARAKQSQVESRIVQAEAGIEGARLMQSYTTITAPFSGVVTAKMAEVGQLAAPGVPLLTVENSGSYRLDAVVEESRIGAITVGGTVGVRIEALSAALEGKVSEIVPAADPHSRTFTVKVTLPQAEGVRSGMYGKALFPVGEEKLLSIPQSAVVNRGQLTGVFIVDSESKARLRLVKLGKVRGERIEVLSGLSEGNSIVVSPDKVEDGSPLQVRQSEVVIESAQQVASATVPTVEYLGTLGVAI